MRMLKINYVIGAMLLLCGFTATAQIKLVDYRGTLRDTAILLNGRVKVSDTAAMLLPYARKKDSITASPFFIAGTSTAALNNKMMAIDRAGSIITKSGFLRSGFADTLITINGLINTGPVIDFGNNLDSSKFLRFGYYNSLVNLDIKSLDFNLFSSSLPYGIYMNNTTGNISLNTNNAATVAAATSGSTANTQLAKFSVAGADASLNTLTIGLGGGQLISNTALGDSVLFNNTTGAANVAVGYKVLYNNLSASNNSGIGFQSLYNTTTGGDNTAAGFQSLFNNTSGSINTALGWRSLYNNTSGIRNTSVGYAALYKNLVGNDNIAVGYAALDSSTGSSNNAIGAFSLSANTTGSNNTVIGNSTLSNQTTANNNLAIGQATGGGITSGGSNTIIGANVAGLSSSMANNIIIADGDGNRRINIIANGNVGIGNTSPGNKLEITHGTAGNSGLRFTNLLNSSFAFSASSVNEKYLAVNANGDVVLAAKADPVISVNDLASGLVSPVAAASFQLGTFEDNYSKTDSAVIYINQADGTQWIYSAASGGIYKSYTAASSTEWYSALTTTDAGSNKTSGIYRPGSVAIGTSTPNSSAILDLTSTTKAFYPQRLTANQRDSIANPIKGMVVYCTNCNNGNGCISTYSTSWGCIKDNNSLPAVTVNCATGFQGSLVQGINIANVYYRITLSNNTFSTVDIAVSSADLVLSGANGGITVGAPALTAGGTAVTTVTLNSGANQYVYYPLTGSPTTIGTLTAKWKKITLNCTNTATISALSSVLSVNCSAISNGFYGPYINGTAFNSTDTFSITVTNISGVAISGIIAPTVGNLVLSNNGTYSTAAVVSSVKQPTSTFNLAIGASQVITYNLTGTPSSTGVITGTWTLGNLSCVKTKNITNGDATFSSSPTAFVFSVNDLVSSPNVVSQGKLDTNTVIQMPYTGGVGSYTAYNSPFVSIPSQYCEDGASDWTFGYSYSAGTFAASGNISVTLITKKAGVKTIWNAKRVSSVSTINFGCVTAPWVLNGNTYTNTIGIDEGGDAIRGALSSAGCASCTAYDAAAINTLVPITLTEYTKLQTFLTGAALKGYVGNMNTTMTAFGTTGGTNNISTGIVNALQANSYVVAAALQVYTATTASLTAVTAAASSSGAVTCLTGASPSVAWAAYTTRYFTVKRPTTNSGSLTYVGHLGAGLSTCYPTNTIGCYYGNNTCGGSSTNAHPYAIGFQVIATTTKSW